MESREGAITRARQTFAAVWANYCDTFHDDERARLETKLKLVRQRLWDSHGIDVGGHFLSTLPGYLDHNTLLVYKHPRFTWE